MTKAECERIAKALRKSKPSALVPYCYDWDEQATEAANQVWFTVLGKVVRALGEADSRFNVEKFLEVCGLE